MKSNPYIFNLFTYNTHDLANRAIMRGGGNLLIFK